MTLLLLIASLARGADRVALILPAEEASSAWGTAAAMAGLTISGPGPGASVRLSDGGAGWTITARDRDGAEKSMALAPPRTALDREDALWLAVSLLAALPHPPDLGGAAPEPIQPLPVPPPPSVALRKRSGPRPTQPPPEVTPSLPSPPLVIPAAPLLKQSPVFPSQFALEIPRQAPVQPVRPWARVGPAVVWRADTAPSAGVDVTAGATVAGSLWLGLGTTLLSSHDLLVDVAAAKMSAMDANAGVWWSPVSPRLAPILGATVGLSARSYTQGGDTLTRFLVPRFSGEAGASALISDRQALVLSGRLAVDGTKTYLKLPDGTTQILSPIQVELALTVRQRIL